MSLEAAYAQCRRLNAQHGKTFYLATLLLPANRRPAVHALYGFARLADEVVDNPGSSPADELDALERELKAALAGAPEHPVLAALADTVARYGIDPGLFDEFLASMRMDLDHREYASYAELRTYTRGSAEVIGLQMLPVLGVVAEGAEPYAAALGEAFQLTNFLRDVAEDLDRGRVYLPADELAAFGVDRALLEWCRLSGGRDRRVRAALAHLAARTRAVYRRAAPGIRLLEPSARPCVSVAFTLYQGILDQLAVVDYDVFGRRAVVPTSRRLAVALPGLVRALAAR
ncbi:phytoene/squalene synthase family protein [Kutzneria sp. CA-103260]|uniref:phytoene/squalene synthase family protein n=1 Tax=Kutzneria sp. CA-103260 TaxID=2802641 RepID=UPI001BEFC410|nr:phytoene/squalene synthase family protein [Kutzneria sp. CA-103260]QUQ67731.1 phytoene synthase [Kutzneria sp. CA-103260]